ncbi:MAG TPA: spore germination protein GerW family protein [Anaerolineae bacterium]|nr:spore germination protein GerW family protein [Anaerolineae bacterium]
MSNQKTTTKFEQIVDAPSMNNIFNRLFDAIQIHNVFSPPVTHDQHTIINASEIIASFGAGYGGGFTDGKDEHSGSGGGGGGGGGAAYARPVATIIISPDRVQVEPIIDATKLGLALFTTISTMLVFWFKMRRKAS